MEDKTVRDLAMHTPGAARVFEARRIDYCCGGARSLSEACAAAGVGVAEVVAELERAPRDATTEVWEERPMTDLIEHILTTHHEHDRREIERLRALTTKVASVHGTRHPELVRVRNLFFALADELEPHMMKEERILFPYVKELDQSLRGKGARPNAFFGSVANPIAMMMNDHGTVGDLLRDLRTTTKDYALPQDACASYTALYTALEEFELDLHKHIHLENNILFPRAMRGEDPAAAE